MGDDNPSLMDRHELYGLPFHVEVNVIVDRRFYLRPVIPHMQHNTDIAVLLLSMNDTALVFSDASNRQYEMQTPPEALKSFENYMSVYDQEESLQFRSQGYAGGTNKTRAGYHGQGVAEDDAAQKAHLKEYFKQLENWVDETLQNKGFQEVFLIAEPHLEGLYKQVMRNNHPQLRKLAQKNPQSENLEVWITHVKNLLKDDFEQECERNLATYERLKSKDESSIEETVPDIVRAAHSQRVEAFMLPNTSQDYYWGRFDPNTRKVHEQKQDESVSGPGDELINLAAIKTFLHGGKVLPMPEGTLPQYAALCRWYSKQELTNLAYVRQIQSQKPHKMKEIIMIATDMPVNMEEALDGIPFPAAKVQIITYADEQGASEEAMELLRALPVKSYNNMEEINAGLGLVEEQPGSKNLWSSQAKAKG